MRNLILIVLFIIVIILLTQPMSEHYENPQTSSAADVEAGASLEFSWGGPDIKDEHKKQQRNKRQHKERKCPKCDHIYIDNEVCNIVIDDRYNCKYCDITKNKDIDKYVLKSSVPPCPDMSKYATKSMLQPQIDMNKYMLKSKLPEYCAAYQPDQNKYMLKTHCAPNHKYVQVYKDITKHPDYDKYLSKEHCKQYKKSWIQDFGEWWENMFGATREQQNGSQKENRKAGFPTGYAYTPYAGYGTNNPGYALDGGYVKERHFATPEGGIRN